MKVEDQNEGYKEIPGINLYVSPISSYNYLSIPYKNKKRFLKDF